MNNLANFFHDSFDVLTDDSHEVMDEAFRLRYQVYCLETGFENRAAFADGRERDQFDMNSVHGVIQHRDSGTSMATVRLVTRPSSGLGARFPIEHHFPNLLTENGITDRLLPRCSTGEISRFAVSKDFGRQMARIEGESAGDGALSAGPVTHPYYNSRRCPLATFGLFLALVRMSVRNDITHWLAVMEPSLLRLLARFGIRFTPIGDVIDYHGKRQPCYGRVDSVLDGILERRLDLWHLITDGGTHHMPQLPQVAMSNVAEPALSYAS